MRASSVGQDRWEFDFDQPIRPRLNWFPRQEVAECDAFGASDASEIRVAVRSEKRPTSGRVRYAEAGSLHFDNGRRDCGAFHPATIRPQAERQAFRGRATRLLPMSRSGEASDRPDAGISSVSHLPTISPKNPPRHRDGCPHDRRSEPDRLLGP